MVEAEVWNKFIGELKKIYIYNKYFYDLQPVFWVIYHNIIFKLTWKFQK